MIPPALFNSEEQLFQDMSSAGEDEDWTSIEHYHRKKKGAKRSLEASSGNAEIGPSSSRSRTATNGEGSTTKKLKFGGELLVEEPLKILPKTTVRTSTAGRAGNDLSRPNMDTSAALNTAGSADLSVSDPRPPRVPSPEHVPAATRQHFSLPALPVKEHVKLASGRVSGEVPSQLTDVKPPAKRSSSGASVRPITKEALLRQNIGSSSKTLAGKKRKGGAAADSSKTKKQLPYFEYAVQIMDRLNTVVPESKILAGLVLFMVTSEPTGAPVTTKTQLRLDYVIKHGGKVQPQFDPATATHIICDLPARQTSTKSTIKRYLDGTVVDEVPWHIRIVPWAWVCNSVTDRKLADQLKAELYHGRMRLDVRPSTPPPSRRNSRGYSPIEDFDETPDRPTRKTPDPESPTIERRELHESTTDTGMGAAVDPLVRFYEHALYGDDDDAEDDHDDSKHTEEGGLSEHASAPPSEMPKRKGFKGYACQNTGQSKGTGLNDDIIAKLQELSNIHDSSKNKDDQWKVLAYRKAIGSLRRCEKRITLQNLDEARRLSGIGEKTAKKIAEILATGGLQRIQFEQTEEHNVCKVLCGIYGVGATTVYQWYQNGIKSLDDVRDGKGGLVLSENQKIGLEYYDDLQDRMPREEASAIFEKIKAIALRLDPKLLIEIMGSYRRGRADCGDIDILITRCTDDGRTHRGILAGLIRELQEEKLVTHTLAAPDDYGALEAKFMGLCRLSDESKIRRIDVLAIPHDQWGASLIYFTGDDIFNRSMRLLARHKGMSLNQRGLFKGVIRDPKTGLKQCAGTLVASRTEEEIFQILGVPWQLPQERVRSR